MIIPNLISFADFLAVAFITTEKSSLTVAELFSKRELVNRELAKTSDLYVDFSRDGLRWAMGFYPELYSCNPEETKITRIAGREQLKNMLFTKLCGFLPRDVVETMMKILKSKNKL